MNNEEKKPLAFVLEDDPALANIFETCIRSAGFNTIIASEGGSAVQMLEEYNPDLFVLDLHVPIYSGDQILEMVRANPKFDKARIILATADARMAEQLRSKVDFVMDKPVSSRQLRRLVGRLAEDYAANH